MRQSMVPTLVPKEELINAVALNSAAFNMTKGDRSFSVGGLLIVAFGVGAEIFSCRAPPTLRFCSPIYWMVIPPAPTEAKRSIGAGQSEGRSALCLVQSNGVRAAHGGAGAAHLCHAVSNPPRRFSKGRPRGRTRRLGDSCSQRRGWEAMLAGLLLASLAHRVQRQGMHDAFQPYRSRHRHEYVFLDDVFPLAILALVNIGAFQIFTWPPPAPLPGHRAGSFARQGREHLQLSTAA